MAATLDSLEFEDVEFDDVRLNSIKNYYREVPGLKTQRLNEVRSLLTEISNLRPCLDDSFLLRFLRSAKYRPLTVLKRLKTYYFSRNLYPEIFQNYLPSNTLRAQALNHIKALPYRAKNLSAIVVIKLGQADFQQVPFTEVLRLWWLVFETLMQNPMTQLCGITVIIDCDDASQDDMSEINTFLPVCFDVFHTDCTLGIRYLHVVNVPALLYLLYQNMLPSFPPEDYHQAVFYLPDSDLEELHNQVSLDYLPEEYGGKLSPSSYVDLNSMVNEKEDYFREHLQYGVLNDELELD
ncbi:alpha-tocopherol transfer protein-like [Argiope bruennichi]|uniref:alpha-tocopherol transfer protein-like n=1 Tax=Argiope bruennichi TaxID=94029 RepID=UPI002493D0D9|nr:alpha-tocopherol transfer protein-like [Argiope bruennichi]XP_055946040.1 alpha-tocopherol transfer protein-like [Argiope bruennichi]XP_055946041.1 alpha-tocopherol transfer protein-like [Argiope bruennichi]XP_055946042.1 alpha-tocopherol transfer protein-like [Argiope bruennichi]